MQNKQNHSQQYQEKVISDEMKSSNIYGISEQYHSNSNLLNDINRIPFDGLFYENQKENQPPVDISNDKTKEENSKLGNDLNDSKNKENSQKTQTCDNIISYSENEKYILFRQDSITSPFFEEQYGSQLSNTDLINQNKEDILPHPNFDITNKNNLLNKKRDREFSLNNNNEIEKDSHLENIFNFNWESINEDSFNKNSFLLDGNKEPDIDESQIIKYFNSDISTIKQKESEINLTNSNIKENIELFVYNFDEQKNSNGKIYPPLSDIPNYISIENIIPYIGKIISKENGIFDGTEDFYRITETGGIFNNIKNILENKETNQLDKANRPLQMAKKYKTFVIGQMLSSTNNFLKLKNMKTLKKIDKYKINEPVKASFNFNLFPKPIYSILSNDLRNGEKKKNNYDIIKTIIDDYNKNKEETPLIKHLCLTYEECLNIILYKNEDPEHIFKSKLNELIEENYKELKYDIETKKDYIAGFILLGYNLKNFYYGIKSRGYRQNKKLSLNKA